MHLAENIREIIALQNTQNSKHSRNVIRHDNWFGDVPRWDVSLHNLGFVEGNRSSCCSVDGHHRGVWEMLSAPCASHNLLVNQTSL